MNELNQSKQEFSVELRDALVVVVVSFVCWSDRPLALAPDGGFLLARVLYSQRHIYRCLKKKTK